MSVKEASCALLGNPKAKILAGGTDLLVNMKHRVEVPSAVVNIKRIPDLDFIEKKNGAIRMGALTSLKRIYESSLVKENLAALASAASSVGSYHHQSMGTIGGNICQQNRCKYFNQSPWWRSSRPLCFKAGGEICHVVNKKGVCYSNYSGDLAPVLLALNAGIRLESENGAREISVERLFSGDGKAPLLLRRGEILTEVTIPEEAVDGISVYMRFANRESIDFPIVGLALWASMESKEVRVSLTSVDQRPVRAKDVEGFLRRKDLTEETLEEVAGLASRAANPVKTSIYSPAYKRKIMGLLVKRALKGAMRSARR